MANQAGERERNPDLEKIWFNQSTFTVRLKLEIVLASHCTFSDLSPTCQALTSRKLSSALTSD
jgi:hypothetical protein